MASLLDRMDTARRTSLVGGGPPSLGMMGMGIGGTEGQAPAEPTESPGGTLDPMRAGYDDQGQKCGDCEYFSGPNACQIVSGAINESGWCKLFERGESGGGMDETALEPEEEA